jgi:hypothetical protein
LATSKRRARRSGAQWQGLVDRAVRSPLSIEAFCRTEGVSTASFYSWRKRLGAPTPGASVAEPTAEEGTFLELGTLGPEVAGTAPWDIELELGAGMVLRLRRR